MNKQNYLALSGAGLIVASVKNGETILSGTVTATDITLDDYEVFELPDGAHTISCSEVIAEPKKKKRYKKPYWLKEQPREYQIYKEKLKPTKVTKKPFRRVRNNLK
jgi:hypothetical protein